MSTIEAWFYSLPPFTKTYMVAAVASTLLAEIAAGELKVVIDKRFSLEEAADAHAYIEDRLAFGRVVLIP